MQDKDEPNDNEEDRLFTRYGEIRVLLDADPKVLHEVLTSCEPRQLEQIMSVMENNLHDYAYEAPGDIYTARQLLSVWFIAVRTWDKKTSSGDEIEKTELDFQTLKYDQHWD